MTVAFELDRAPFVALNGGPQFTFSEAISFAVNCETQADIDRLWEKLSEGGEPGVCGWLKDRYGVSWQIVPSVLPKLLGGSDPKGAARAMQAMLKMSKLDAGALQRAYDGV